MAPCILWARNLLSNTALKVALANTAGDRHSKISKAAGKFEGCDRHLLGLKLAALTREDFSFCHIRSRIQLRIHPIYEECIRDDLVDRPCAMEVRNPFPR